MSNNKKDKSRQDRQMWILRGLNFWQYAILAVLAPFLPLYFADLGYSSSQVGFLMMIGPFAASLIQPFWGYLSDRLRAVKIMIFLLWSLAIASSIGLFNSGTSYALTLCFVLALYFFFQPSMPLLDSISVQSAERRGVAYGSLRLFGSMGYTVVSLSGGVLLAALGGIAKLPYLLWAAWIVPLLLLFFLRDEPAEGEGMSLKSIKELFTNKSFLWFLFMVFIISVPHRMNDVMLGLYMKELGASDSMAGWAWALAAAVEIPVFALIGKYINRIHEYVLIGIVGLVYALRWLMYYLTDDPWVLLALQAGAAVTFAIFWIVSMHYVARILPPQLCATGFSLLSMVYLGLSGMTGGVIGGRLADLFGGESMYLFAVFTSFAGGILFLATEFYSRRRV
ncbi:PPP family 3-phenylpropionic acid transporter [Fontibacillus phaseoli]|uniref:PPP family 3-phenylpropionic acid transporter n=1 Tax=Fontibacillus phaseoli TaxID=1416533 RepID=A0A369BLU1_9BACL|nr:MFS transporter [Fontibacillus phaseoli]RCX22559.1 PPP family 3-phenylpropionic acid transporter [Fontibacillus phaseoli]